MSTISEFTLESYSTAVSNLISSSSDTTYHTAISLVNSSDDAEFTNDSPRIVNNVRGDQYNETVVDHRTNYNNTTQTTTVDFYNNHVSYYNTQIWSQCLNERK